MSVSGKLRIAVTGATGLVGRRLCAMLAAKGHEVFGLRRGSMGEARWNVESGEIAVPGGAGGGRLDAVVHLAGYNVAERWTARVKKEIWDSRVVATERLCGFLAKMPEGERPRALIAASAIGIYGDRGDEVLTEESAVAAKGAGFLSDVCLGWEAATRAAEEAGMRVVHVRVGVVLSKDGGALKKLAVPVKMFMGGPVGNGRQFMPWVSNGDLCRMIGCAAEDEGFSGVMNGVGPGPVRQHEFVRVLGKVSHRPTVFPLPGFVVKLMFGQMGVEALLASLRVMPTRMPAGFAFEHSTLEAAIRAELGR